MYYDIKINFYMLHLLLELVDHMNDVLCLAWLTKLASQVQHATFYFQNKLYMLHMIYPRMGVRDIIKKESWALAIDFMKQHNIPQLLQV